MNCWWLTILLVDLGLIATVQVNGASWQETGHYFYDLLDVGINDANAGYAAALVDGIGSVWLKTADLGKNWTAVEERDGFFDLACSSFDARMSAMNGLLGKGLYTVDGGTTIHDSVSIVAGTQTLSRNRNAQQTGVYLYGAPAGGGLSVSSDFGLTYTHHKASDINATRYAALPSANVWYITAGLWDEEDTMQFPIPDEFDIRHSLSSKIHLWYSSKTKRSQVYFKGIKPSPKRHSTSKHKKYKGKGANRKPLQLDAIWGAIYKTSDSGQTWTQVYENKGEFYFNAIDCCTEQLCYAVAEGDSDAGSRNPGSRVLQTQDGGETWNIVYFNPLDGSSLMGVHCVNSNEAWAAGGTIIERDFHGDFLYTSNNGQNWTDIQVNDPVLYLDMSDDSTTGLASGLTKSGEGVSYGYM